MELTGSLGVHDYVLPASSVGKCCSDGAEVVGSPLQLSVDVVRDATADYPLHALIDALG
jgi:hypothetical protein